MCTSVVEKTFYIARREGNIETIIIPSLKVERVILSKFYRGLNCPYASHAYRVC